MSSQNKVLFFDLGNVIISFDHQKMCLHLGELFGLPCDNVLELFHRFLDPIERGMAEAQLFYEALSLAGGRNPAWEAFNMALSDIFAIKPAVVSLLGVLKKKKHRLFLLSNTCPPHVNFIKTHYAIFELFDDCFFSFDLKARKPEKESFERALMRANVAPKEVYFVDDMLENVVAARTLGIEAHHFLDVNLLEAALEARGFI